MNEHFKYPRLYVPALTDNGKTAPLNSGQAHYLKSVLRMNEGDHIRVFNDSGGEWIADIEKLGKKEGIATVKEQIRTGANPAKALHLLFPPLKKHRMDFLIEKSVELGVTDLHPVLTTRTQVRKINADRIEAQIIEASEQCERLDIPRLHKLQDMDKKLAGWDATPQIICALERDSEIQSAQNGGEALLIGPEGGFDDRERGLLLDSGKIQAVSLGDRILRAETAALYCLSLAGAAKNPE